MSTAGRIPLPVVGRETAVAPGLAPDSGDAPGGAGPTINGFLRDLVDQLRAADTYGQFEGLSDERLLAPFVLTREQRRDLPGDGEVDPITEGRLRSYFQAISAGVEKATGLVTSYVLDLSREGFGRVVVFAGRLVAMSDVLRDAHRFGFDSLAQLGERGDALVRAAVLQIETYPEPAHDDR